MTDFVVDRWGREIFTYAISGVVVLIWLAALAFLVKRRSRSISNFIWLFCIGGVYVYLAGALKGGSPEEAIHYVLYAGLGVLLYRAFTHRVRDHSIYVVATLVGTLIGIIDEVIQWVVPGRYFDTRDIWLNFTGLALVQVALAKGIRPQIISGWPEFTSLRRVCLVGAIVAAVLGLCHFNTPDNIVYYTDRISPLRFFQDFDDVMFEFAYRYEDPETGPFRSRLTLEELKVANQTRAQSGARILDQFQGREKYRDFLKIYTAAKDPFLHEARAHLFSRDANLELGETVVDVDVSRQAYTYAYREHQILQKYFGELYSASSSQWPVELKKKVEGNLISGLTRESLVGRGLLTTYTQRQALLFFSFLVIALLVSARHLGRRASLLKRDALDV